MHTPSKQPQTALDELSKLRRYQRKGQFCFIAGVSLVLLDQLVSSEISTFSGVGILFASLGSVGYVLVRKDIANEQQLMQETELRKRMRLDE
ncbi:hypothetical protein ACFPAF_01690 [Hymenobacter endophyticus]|uniref:DUF202 domain-containing protein n=1 Tax=Hymenobacter endophyticus TaxID=3076335 RepID=A0ABU3TCS6_9BACT|nr:hypothetical protein [Hymenobacter endophyticus]MDU0369090.1 hypothetical protein [Hymenobacter endophyticus]